MSIEMSKLLWLSVKEFSIFSNGYNNDEGH